MVTRAEKKAAKDAANGKDPVEQKGVRVEKPPRVVYGFACTHAANPVTSPLAGHGEPFQTEAEAQRALDNLTRVNTHWHNLINSSKDYKFFVVPMPWQDREKAEFQAVRYRHPPWCNETFMIMVGSKIKGLIEHFPHVGTKDPTMLAFTPTPEDGARDRQAIMKPGKYLKKFYGAGDKGKIAFGPLKGRDPVLNEREIAYYAEWWEKGSKPSIYGAGELKFAKTPEEIVGVYAKGPRSCMDSRNHMEKAVEVYGAGDIQVAYLQFGEKIRARAICWPEAKGFGRCYPAPQNYSGEGFKSEADSQLMQDELRNRLLMLGWTDIQRNGGILNGARITKIKIAKGAANYGPGRYYMPYLDSHVKATATGPEPDKFFYLKHDGEYETNQYGYIQVRESFVCPHCKHTKFVVNERGQDLTRQVFTGWTKKAGPIGAQTWCYDCAHRTYECAGTGNRFEYDNMEYDEHSGRYVKGWLAAHGHIKCGWTDRWFVPDPKNAVFSSKGEPVALNSVDSKEGFVCRHNNVAYLPGEGSLKFCGFPKTMDNDETITPEQRLAGDLRRRTQVWNRGRWTYEHRTWEMYLHNWQMRVDRSEAAKQRKQTSSGYVYTTLAAE